jgi:hypothetical protein
VYEYARMSPNPPRFKTTHSTKLGKNRFPTSDSSQSPDGARETSGVFDARVRYLGDEPKRSQINDDRSLPEKKAPAKQSTFEFKFGDKKLNDDGEAALENAVDAWILWVDQVFMADTSPWWGVRTNLAERSGNEDEKERYEHMVDQRVQFFNSPTFRTAQATPTESRAIFAMKELATESDRTLFRLMDSLVLPDFLTIPAKSYTTFNGTGITDKNRKARWISSRATDKSQVRQKLIASFRSAILKHMTEQRSRTPAQNEGMMKQTERIIRADYQWMPFMASDNENKERWMSTMPMIHHRYSQWVEGEIIKSMRIERQDYLDALDNPVPRVNFVLVPSKTEMESSVATGLWGGEITKAGDTSAEGDTLFHFFENDDPVVFRLGTPSVRLAIPRSMMVAPRFDPSKRVYTFNDAKESLNAVEVLTVTLVVPSEKVWDAHPFYQDLPWEQKNANRRMKMPIQAMVFAFDFFLVLSREMYKALAKAVFLDNKTWYETIKAKNEEIPRETFGDSWRRIARRLFASQVLPQIIRGKKGDLIRRTDQSISSREVARVMRQKIAWFIGERGDDFEDGALTICSRLPINWMADPEPGSSGAAFITPQDVLDVKHKLRQGFRTLLGAQDTDQKSK